MIIFILLLQHAHTRLMRSKRIFSWNMVTDFRANNTTEREFPKKIE